MKTLFGWILILSTVTVSIAGLLQSGLEAGKAAPIFKAKTMEEKEVQFPSAYKGKIVLLNFWATWCHPCVEEQPKIVEVYKKYKNQNFEVLGVTLDDAQQTAKIEAVEDQKGMTWPQIYEGLNTGGKIARAYGIGGIPQNFLIDGDTGKILKLTIAPEELDKTIFQAIHDKFGGSK